MTIIDRVRSVIAQRAQGEIERRVTGALPGLMGRTVTGVITRGIAGGVDAARQALPSVRALPDLVLGEVQRRADQRVAAAARKVQDALGKQIAGRLPATLPGLSGIATPVPRAPALPSAKWAPAPLFGGLTLDRYRQLFVQSAMTAKGWKNLFHLSIGELTPSKEAPQGADGLINLLAVDVSFAPCTMPGDVVQIGGANIDHLAASERVELRLTTMDDDRGSLKRWFAAKADQAVHTDGTMGLPVDYLVVIAVTHMDPEGKAGTDARLRHRWLMRPTNMDIELSRRAPELEELQLSFVQFDTFMAAQ